MIFPRAGRKAAEGCKGSFVTGSQWDKDREELVNKAFLRVFKNLSNIIRVGGQSVSMSFQKPLKYFRVVQEPLQYNKTT